MSIKTISKFLIFFGIGVIVIALNMDTSVSTGYGRVQNIGLMSQQQNILIIGGLAFIAGVVLFATATLKQSPQEEAAEKLKRQDQIARAGDSINLVATGTVSALEKWWGELDNVLGRVGVFFFVGVISGQKIGLMIWFMSGMKWTLANIVLGIFLIGSFLYSLRPIPAKIVMTHLLIANVVGFALIELVDIVQYLLNGELDLNPVYPLGFMFVSGCFIGLIKYLDQRKSS